MVPRQSCFTINKYEVKDESQLTGTTATFFFCWTLTGLHDQHNFHKALMMQRWQSVRCGESICIWTYIYTHLRTILLFPYTALLCASSFAQDALHKKARGFSQLCLRAGLLECTLAHNKSFPLIITANIALKYDSVKHVNIVTTVKMSTF